MARKVRSASFVAQLEQQLAALRDVELGYRAMQLYVAGVAEPWEFTAEDDFEFYEETDVLVVRDGPTDENGNDLHNAAAWNVITKKTTALMRKLGKGEGYGLHTLRHTCASWIVQRGVDLGRVQKHMRHESIVMTQRYAHLAPQHLDDVVLALDAARSAESGVTRMDTQLDTRRRARG